MMLEALVFFLIVFLVVAFPKQGVKALVLCLGVCLLLAGAFFGYMHFQQERAHAAYLEEYGPSIRLVNIFRGFLARGGSWTDPRLSTDDLQACLSVEPSSLLKDSEADAIRAELKNREILAKDRTLSPAVPNPAILFPEYRDEPLTLGPSNRNWKPLYINPKLVPTPTPAPVVKPTPPVPAKPETLYTSN